MTSVLSNLHCLYVKKRCHSRSVRMNRRSPVSWILTLRKHRVSRYDCRYCSRPRRLHWRRPTTDRSPYSDLLAANKLTQFPRTLVASHIATSVAVWFFYFRERLTSSGINNKFLEVGKVVSAPLNHLRNLFTERSRSEQGY